MNEHATTVDAFRAAADSDQQHAGPWKPPDLPIAPCPTCPPGTPAHHRWVFPAGPLTWQQHCTGCDTVTAHTDDHNAAAADRFFLDTLRDGNPHLTAAGRAVHDIATGADPLDMFTPGWGTTSAT